MFIFFCSLALINFLAFSYGFYTLGIKELVTHWIPPANFVAGLACAIAAYWKKRR